MVPSGRWIRFVYSVSELDLLKLQLISTAFLIVDTRLISVYCKR